MAGDAAEHGDHQETGAIQHLHMRPPRKYQQRRFNRGSRYRVLWLACIRSRHDLRHGLTVLSREWRRGAFSCPRVGVLLTDGRRRPWILYGASVYDDSMNDTKSVHRPRKHVVRLRRDTAILTLPNQTGEAIRRRREIREAFHDSKARTINPKRG